MQAVHTIGSTHVQRTARKRNYLAMSVAKKLAISALLIFAFIFVVFIPTGADTLDNFVMSVGISSSTSQSAAHTLFTSAAAERDPNDGGKTSVDLSEAYVDASGHVASYSKGLVESKNGLVVGTNSPTREFDAEHAYVVNISELLTAEAQDIITFEQNTLGLTGHASAEEYALQKLPIENSITNHYGGGSKNLWYGAVGPAITIRNFYAEGKYKGYPTGASEYFGCFGGADNAYLDAMLVKNDDVEKYLSGEDVPVVYVQFRMFGGNAKAHSAPWGVTQTYFQMNSGGTMQPNTTSGDFTPTSYGVTDITGNASEDMARLLTLARDYASKGRPVYWWPTIEATREDLGISTLQSFTSFTSGTANIFESFDTDQYATLQQEYAGYSLVGILVYAVK